jgi:hypothetical protein
VKKIDVSRDDSAVGNIREWAALIACKARRWSGFRNPRPDCKGGYAAQSGYFAAELLDVRFGSCAEELTLSKNGPLLEE